MLSRAVWRSALRATVRRTAAVSRQQQQRCPTHLTAYCLSTEAASTPPTEEIVPGIGKGKTSTGLVGLPVEPDWYNVMLEKFQHLLDRLEQSDMPETAQYRIDVTKWCNFVIKTVKENPNDPETVEREVGMGQVEELIDMANDEDECMTCYLQTRMWELVEESHPVFDFDPNPMRDPFGENGNPYEQEAIRKGMEDREPTHLKKK